MRIDWSERDYSVICHSVWSVRSKLESIKGKTLKYQPGYFEAKKNANIVAAQQIIDNMLSPEGLKAIWDKCNPERFDLDPKKARPYVVAPTKASGSNNVIPMIAAHNIAYHLNCGIDRDIFQIDTVGRTGKSSLDRIINRAHFSGKVTVGREYIIVDDNFTLGGTIADLRSYIESQGGKVLCASVLADRDKDKSIDPWKRARMHEIRLNATNEDIREIKEHYGWQFDRKFKREVGISLESLTKREASVVRGFPDQRAFFNAIATARGGDVASGNSRSVEREPTRTSDLRNLDIK